MIKTTLIGLGIMGQRMAEHMVRHPAFEVVALWDPDPAACAAAAAFAPDAVIAANAQAAIAAGDLVYLAL